MQKPCAVTISGHVRGLVPATSASKASTSSPSGSGFGVIQRGRLRIVPSLVNGDTMPVRAVCRTARRRRSRKPDGTSVSLFSSSTSRVESAFMPRFALWTNP